MTPLASLVLILLVVVLGLAVGRSPLLPGSPLPGRLLDLCLYALLFSMGLRIGESDAIRSQIARVGLIAGVSALTAVMGTAVAVTAIALLGRWNRRAPTTTPAADRSAGAPTDGEEAPGTGPSTERPPVATLPRRAAGRVMVHLKDPVRLFAAVIAGFAVGYLLRLLPEATVARITDWLLYLLVFLVGFQLARSGLNLRSALLRPRTLIVPGATIVGTLAASLLVVPIVGLPVGKALAVAAGFGWYSLSGVLITNLGDPVLGSAAFVSNMLREGVALLLIPLLGRLGLRETAVGIAGATSMDVTLPLISRNCGESTVPLAVASGAILSFLVPIFVPVLYRL